uniref:AlNc14C269G9936 protein n=1 Tax=Albugo laibachii Nc14 TaxID=890382 RepID=F0WUB5_9STRA|nr:AlNc14C269G9936 [Albugo laibachii Nc14]|eukprot:CCA24993.1 AlNc14C269G9936 [Albugo laibachii Nc14]
MDSGELDLLKMYFKDFIVEESTDLEDDFLYIIDVDYVKFFGLDLINLYEDYMHDVEELMDEANDVLCKYYQVE